MNSQESQPPDSDRAPSIPTSNSRALSPLVATASPRDQPSQLTGGCSSSTEDIPVGDVTAAIDTATTIAPSENPPNVERAMPIVERFLCKLCQRLIQDPVITKDCRHSFCRSCLTRKISKEGNDCPVCNQPIIKNGYKNDFYLAMLLSKVKTTVTVEKQAVKRKLSNDENVMMAEEKEGDRITLLLDYLELPSVPIVNLDDDDYEPKGQEQRMKLGERETNKRTPPKTARKVRAVPKEKVDLSSKVLFSRHFRCSPQMPLKVLHRLLKLKFGGSADNAIIQFGHPTLPEALRLEDTLGMVALRTGWQRNRPFRLLYSICPPKDSPPVLEAEPMPQLMPENAPSTSSSSSSSVDQPVVPAKPPLSPMPLLTVSMAGDGIPRIMTQECAQGVKRRRTSDTKPATVSASVPSAHVDQQSPPQPQPQQYQPQQQQQQPHVQPQAHSQPSTSAPPQRAAFLFNQPAGMAISSSNAIRVYPQLVTLQQFQQAQQQFVNTCNGQRVNYPNLLATLQPHPQTHQQQQQQQLQQQHNIQQQLQKHHMQQQHLLMQQQHQQFLSSSSTASSSSSSSPSNSMMSAPAMVAPRFPVAFMSRGSPESSAAASRPLQPRPPQPSQPAQQRKPSPPSSSNKRPSDIFPSSMAPPAKRTQVSPETAPVAPKAPLASSPIIGVAARPPNGDSKPKTSPSPSTTAPIAFSTPSSAMPSPSIDRPSPQPPRAASLQPSANSSPAVAAALSQPKFNLQQSVDVKPSVVDSKPSVAPLPPTISAVSALSTPFPSSTPEVKQFQHEVKVTPIMHVNKDGAPKAAPSPSPIRPVSTDTGSIDYGTMSSMRGEPLGRTIKNSFTKKPSASPSNGSSTTASSVAAPLKGIRTHTVNGSLQFSMSPDHLELLKKTSIVAASSVTTQ